MEFGKAAQKWKEQAASKAKKDVEGPPALKPFVIHQLTPKEFSGYLKGAAFYHKGERDKAIETWAALLSLPEDERYYRSTWAAFMIGKALADDRPNEAVQWFKRVRELAAGGYADSLGLASSSIGWEAKVNLNHKRYSQAIELYMAQLASGDPTAFASLRFSAADACKDDIGALELVARHETARKVLTAYLLSYRKGVSDELKKKWLAATEQARINVVEEADRLAWAAYQCGDFETAKRWLKVGPKDSAMTRWIRAKLLLREGNIPEAADELATIVRQYPAVTRPRVRDRYRDKFIWDLSEVSMSESIRGELGTLHMVRGQYVEALDVLLRGGRWEDAAYVAECVLKPDELIEYVDAKWPEVETDDINDDWYMRRNSSKPEWFGVRIRYMLGRRLARLGRWEEAGTYYPKKWRGRFDLWVASIVRGQNPSSSKPQRSRPLWKAACITRYQGMELLGTEVGPDWFVYGGSYVPRGSRSARTSARTDDVFASSEDEKQRLADSVTPEKRWHYRYIAADYAWQAAELMPDGSDETAKVLCIAGTWLKGKDPEAADRFYKAMVIRCRNTELGKEADRLRWFPKIDINIKELLK
jgi:tetratricopeptide (TPR) repeat protein